MSSISTMMRQLFADYDHERASYSENRRGQQAVPESLFSPNEYRPDVHNDSLSSVIVFSQCGADVVLSSVPHVYLRRTVSSGMC